MGKRLDTKHKGLDAYAHMAKVFGDTPWLHYGLWEAGEKVSFPNLRAAQERYVDKLMALLPPAPARVLDIGGGTGELALRLVEAGYQVDMLTPSDVQADMAREKLGDRARVFTTTFQDFAEPGPYDVCLFSESFQYIPLDDAFAGIGKVLSPQGHVVIADCFRTEAYQGGREPGGGHRYTAFEDGVEKAGYRFNANEDVTEMAAQTMALDQKFYRELVSPLLGQIDDDLHARRPIVRWLMWRAIKLFMPRSERENFAARMKADYRSPERFKAVTSYRFVSLSRTG